MLSELLPLKPRMVIALVGAGGKTTTMFRLAAELDARHQRIITTTTTHIFPPDRDQTGALVLVPARTDVQEQVAQALATHRHITVATAPTSEGKLRGIPPEWTADLQALPEIGVILVEADGAKGRMIKAPAAHEPVIPTNTDLVLLLASAAALGQPLSDSIAHRLEHVTAVTGLAPGEIITSRALAKLVTSDRGLLKSVPPAAKTILVLTHVDQQHLQGARETAALALAPGRLGGALLCSLAWAE